MKVIGWLISLICLILLVRILLNGDTDFWTLVQNTQKKLGFVWVISLVLLPVNIGLEVLKWRVLVTSKQETSIIKATADVLSGLTANLILPWGLGDGFVRLRRGTYFQQLLPEVVLGRAMSLGVTVAFGLLGLTHTVLLRTTEDFIFYGLLFVWIICLLLISIVFDKGSNKRAWIYTLLRYLTFTVQYFVLLRFTFVDLSFVILVSGIFWVFLLRSTLPSVFGAVGIRELSFYLYLQNYTPHPEWVVLPSTFIWFINVVIPSWVGLLYIGKIR